MQVDDIADQHDDLDTDSLFGSPPPSPGRGRSSSPLALPSGQNATENVGTLALPGSHLCSELPPAPLPAPSLKPNPPQPRPQTVATLRQLPQDKTSTVPLGKSRRATPAPRKTKRMSRRPTPATEARTNPPPIQLPSPSEPTPPNFLRNQESLLGLAGLVGGVRPATLSLQRHTRGASASNPIVVEDEQQPASIGRRPLYRHTASSSQLPTPSSDEILATLVKQKNIFPVMDALLRLVAVPARASVPSTTLPVPGSSTAAPQSSVPAHTHYAQAPPTSYAYPYYPYGYSYPYYYSHPYYYSPANYQHSSAGFSSRSAPPPKRRKLTTVPAGAADWDVPYPFEAGQGPPDYQTNWERQRGQQLLEDLVGLVKSAAAKAAAKKAADGEKEDETREDTTLGSVEYYRDRVLRHYRPQTATYGYEGAHVPSGSGLRAPVASSSPSSVPPFMHPLPRPSPSPPPQTASPAAQSQILPPHSVKEAQSSSSANPQVTPLQAVPVQLNEFGLGMTPNAESIIPTTLDDTLNDQETHVPSNIDDFLALFSDLPANDLDALFSSTDFAALPTIAMECIHGGSPQDRRNQASPIIPDASKASQPTKSFETETQSSFDTSLLNIDTSLFAIDPALLALPSTQPAHAVASQSEKRATSVDQVTQAIEQPQSTVLRLEPPSQSPESMSGLGTGASPTPTLVGSPFSLADLDPPTPKWDFALPEPSIVRGGAELDILLGCSGQDSSRDDGTGALLVGTDLRRYVLTKTKHVALESGDVPIEETGKMDKGKGKAREIDIQTDVDAPCDLSVSTGQAESYATSTVTPLVANSRHSTPSSAVARSSSYPTPLNHNLSTRYASLVPPPAMTSPPAPNPQSMSLHHIAPSSASPSIPSFRSQKVIHGKSREDILNRARAMRAQLVGEIERAKVELWETTMESGCLVVAGKELEKV
ncbi:hypothetical protein PHLCEN_2v3128 [Hermanssonia centrifuga]|uniref:Uncharacterized protein n=1 Tax=Hermanssonia centrifuga TaxID=98765 RepID=A0A2R6R3X4_9APHY|nr:hypothetical protein PHLCEN_2v3128 [Hermanssonia centrifuga]